MNILHISAECYPAAKVGGLGDVVGSLPKYLNQLDHSCDVVIPKYETPWLNRQKYEHIYESEIEMAGISVSFQILKVINDELGYDLYAVNIPGKFDRPGVYIDPWTGHAYWDEFERFVSFQIIVLEWLKESEDRPDIIHCHDHHTGLIPFMLSQCNRYREMSDIPNVITVHNAEYQGWAGLDRYVLLPAFSMRNIGLLDWNGQLNSLAAGLKCAWAISTVSESYMEELCIESNGLEQLFRDEFEKSFGIVNGIDADIWDPATDTLLDHNYSFRNRKKGKKENKKQICDEFGLNPELPTISFIGRLVREKGADLLPDLFRNYLYSEKEVNFILLGTGDPQLHEIFTNMEHDHMGYFDATLEYNEQLAHKIYAGSDFILMPSRVEPCGLNQMFAMRYGTIPIVRSVGGLKDTVKDISREEGYGITFQEFNLPDAAEAIERAVDMYYDEKRMSSMITKVMKLDFSWRSSAKKYISMYNKIKSEN
ncbi:glycogen synthase [Balneola sp. MJW-20]|uniref:glycogen synthase n=1 Tax=Gracilimonas aurantiaca TaxID=3234185 RepID=UPI0034657978